MLLTLWRWQNYYVGYFCKKSVAIIPNPSPTSKTYHRHISSTKYVTSNCHQHRCNCEVFRYGVIHNLQDATTIEVSRLQRSSESRTEFEINLLNNAVADIQGEILDRHVAHQQYYHHLEHKYQNISFAQKYLTPRSYSGILFLNIFDYLKEIVQERDW